MNGNKKIFLDTNILIYFFDSKSPFYEKSKDFFNFCIQNEVHLGISTLLLTEFLVGVYSLGLSDLDFFLFLEDANIEIHEFCEYSAKTAARLKTRYTEKIPDLIHIATAIENHYDYFLTNDQNLKKVIDIPVLTLNDFLEKM